jgi:hypothetical protein
MANPTIKVKRSAVSGKIPTVTQLDLGELAINTFDGKIYTERDQSSVGVGTTVIVINPWSVGTGTNTYNTFFTEGNVGVGSTLPTSKFSVVGNAFISGVTTSTAIITGNIKTTGVSTISGFTFPTSDGTTGQSLATDGNGNLYFTSSTSTVGSSSSISDQYFTATQGQTTFTSSQNFTNRSVQVFANGIKLRETTDFTLTEPTTITLVEGLKVNDRLNSVVSFGYTLDEEYFTATQNQTQFSLSGSFSTSENIKVYLNGSKLRTGIDYSASSSVQLVSGATAGDEIDLVSDTAEDYFTATQGQTTFTPSSSTITSSNLQVFLNGVKLESVDYTIVSPKIILTNGASAGDQIDVVITRT